MYPYCAVKVQSMRDEESDYSSFYIVVFGYGDIVTYRVIMAIVTNLLKLKCVGWLNVMSCPNLTDRWPIFTFACEEKDLGASEAR